MREIGECLDDPAVADHAALAAGRHPLQFGAQCREAPQPRIDLADLRRGKRVRSPAIGFGMIGQVEQRADCLALKAQFARMADEAEASQMRRTIDPMAAFGARGRGQPALLLIPPDRRRLDACRAREVADRVGYRSCAALLLPSRGTVRRPRAPSRSRGAPAPRHPASAVSGSSPTAIRKRTTRSCRALAAVGHRPAGLGQEQARDRASSRPARRAAAGRPSPSPSPARHPCGGRGRPPAPRLPRAAGRRSARRSPRRSPCGRPRAGARSGRHGHRRVEGIAWQGCVVMTRISRCKRTT